MKKHIKKYFYPVNIFIFYILAFIEVIRVKGEQLSQRTLSRKRGGIVVLLFMILSGIYTPTFSQTQPIINVEFAPGFSSAQFSCDRLYVGREVFGEVAEVNVSSGSPVTKTMYRIQGSGLTANAMSTLALGKMNDKLTMFGWQWNGNAISYIQQGEKTAYKLNHTPPLPGAGGYNYWSGGEVNQKTGEIYLSSGELDRLGYLFRLGILDPVTGAYRNLGQLNSVSDSDKFTNGLNAYVASDMAIDAEGNAYLVVGHYGNERYLVKVDVKTSQYSKVTRLTGISRADFMYGMAFLDGALYVTGEFAAGRLFKYNTLTGEGVEIGKIDGDTRDLASCQTAPVIRGTVYADVKGDGNIGLSTNEYINEQEIEIWKQEGGRPVYKSTIKTNAKGEFSFIVDTVTEKYYLRLPNPKGSDGKPALQTWAGADASGTPNKVTAYCINRSNGQTESKDAPGLCRGANSTDAAPRSGNPATWGIYSAVQMTTDDKVAVANFALSSASNYPDAPVKYNSAQGPAHLAPGLSGNTVTNTQLNFVHLGKTVSVQSGAQPAADANRIPTHDGVEVALRGSNHYQSLQDFVFVTGEKYTFKIEVNGIYAKDAFLNGWVDWTAQGVAGKFDTSNQVSKDQKLANGNYIYVDYEVPAGSVTKMTESYARFRVSSLSGVTATEAPSGARPIDGEVEDYRVYYVPGDITISAVAYGGTGTFTYTFENITSTLPSTTTDSLELTTEGVEVFSTQRHVFNQLNAPIIIKQVSPNPQWENWQLVDVACQSGSREITNMTFTAEGVVTVPASEVKAGAAISCLMTNSLAPRLEITKNITNRYDVADQFTIAIKDGSDVLESVTTKGTETTATTKFVSLEAGKNYTISEMMAAGSKSALGRYDGVIVCSNTMPGSNSVLPQGSGTDFNINLKNGDQVSCTITNSAIVPSVTHSEIYADPTTIVADGVQESIVTVKVRTENGQDVTVGGDQVEISFADDSHVGEFVGGVVDNADGTYSIKVKSTKNFDKEAFNYTLNGNKGVSQAFVTYTAGKPNAEKSTITATPEEILADGQMISALKVLLMDDNGNLLTSSIDPLTNKAYDIIIGFTDVDAKVGQLSGTSNNNDGSFSATVRSSVAGKDNFNFTVDGITSTDNADVTYMPGTASSENSTIEIDPDSIVADGTTTAAITITLYDANGNKLTTGKDLEGTDYVVELLSKNSDPIGTLSALTNNNDGTFSATVTSAKTGLENFGFTVNGADSKRVKGIRYLPGEFDPAKSTITAIPAEIVADGIDESIIVVQLKDSLDNNLSSNAGNVVITGLKLAVQAGDEVAASYISEGRYELKVVSTVAGIDADIQFKLDGELGADTTEITYLPGNVDLAQSMITVDPKEIVADDTQTALITIQLKDSKGNNLQKGAGTVVLRFNNGTKAVGIPTVVTNHNDGTYTASIKSQIANKSDVIGFMLDSEVSPSAPAELRYIAGEVSLTQSTITASPLTIEADGQTKSDITIQLKDAFGNDIVNPTKTHVVKLDRKSPGIGDFSPSNAQFTYNGNGQFIGEMTSTQATEEQIGFTIDDQKADSTVTLVYKTGGISLTRSEISVDPERIEVNTKEDSPGAIVTVQLYDANGNKPTEETPGVVILTGVETGKSTTDDFKMKHEGEGRYTLKLYSTVTGKDTLGFKFGKDATTAELARATASLEYFAGEVSLKESTIVINPGSIVANDVARANVVVQLKDKFGNPIIGNKGVVTLVDLDIGKLVADDARLKYQSDGTYTGSITSTKVGIDAKIGFNLSGEAENGDKTASLQYTPGQMNLSKSTMTIEPQTIVADDTATALVTIQFKDAFENNIAVEVTQKIQLDGVVFGKVIEDIHYISAGKYTATIVSTKVGTDQIGFKVGDTFGENGARKSLTYTSGKASITKSVFKVNPDEIIANNVSTSLLTLELRDEFANPITIQTDDDVEFLIKGNAPIGEMSEFTNHQNGTYSAIIKSSKTGVDYFDFTLGGVEAKREDVKVTYIPGIPYAGTSEIKATPNEITTDGIERSTVTVQVKDRLGNNITKSLGPNAVVILTEQAATGKLQAIKDNGDGTYSVVVTSTKTGQDTFIFDIEGVRGVGKDTVTYKPGTASTATSEISVEPALIIADGEDSSTVRVVLKDEFGNRLTTNGDHGSETMSVKLTGLVLAVEKDVTLTYDGGTTGSYSGVVRSVSEGADTIGFTLNGKNATGDKSKAVLTYRSGGVNLRTSKIEISKPKITADRVDSAVVTVTLLDENENVIKDVLHDVELVDVKTGIIEGGFKSIGNGQYQGTIVSEKAGVDTIGFTVDANRATKTVTLEYVAGAPDLSTSWIDVQPKSIIANDRDEAVVTVTLLDKYHNPIIENAAQQNVALDMATLAKGKLSDEAGNGVFTSIGEGKYNLRIKSVKTGVDALNYTLGGDKGKGRPASITYTPGLVNLTVSEIKVNPEEIVADGDAMSRVTIQLKDALGNNTTLKEGGTITLRGVTTGKLRGSMVYVKDGLYEGYISSEKTGKDTIGYDISTIGIGKTEATLTYIAGDVDLKQSTIMAVPNSINADGSQFSTITVHLRDAKGNIVPGNHGVVALTGLNLGDVKSEMTFEDNKYVGEISSIKAGSDTLSFTLDDAPGGTNTTVVYKPGKYVLSESVITATPNEIQADGIETSTVTVQLKDRYGNNTDENAGDVHIEGVEIGNMTSLRLTYQNKGLYSGSIKSKKVGSDTLTFNLNGASFTGTPANVTYNAGELDLSVSTIMANPPRIVADGKELSTVTVQLKDKNGNNLPNGINPKTGQSYKVRLIAPTELTGEMIPVSGEMSDNGNGRFVANIKSTTSGDDTFNFEVDGQPGIFTATVHYRAGKVDATNSLISAEPTDIKVSTGEIQSTITVQLRDAEGNLITTGGEQVVINSVDPIGQLSNTKDHGDGRYSATVSSEKVGLEYFGFTVNNVLGSTTTTVRYLPGNVSLDQSTIIAAPKEIVANGVNKSIVSVQLKDGLGNNLDSSAGEVVITGVTLAVQQAPSITATYKGNGLYQLELTSIRAGEDKNISFKLNEVASGKHASIIYHPGALDLAKSVITVSPKSIVADNVDTADITIRLQDSNGNLIGKSAGVVALYFNNGAGAYGKPTDVVDNGDGTYSAKITSTKAHVTDLIGFKVVDQISPSVPAQLTYTHGDYSLEKSELIASPAVIRVSDVDGTVKEASTLTLQLKDAFGNDVHTTAGILTVTITGEGIGQLNGGNNPTVNMIYKADGIYTATVTSTQTGKETFTYKINDEQGESEATVEYKIGALSLLTSQIKVDPAKIEVGGKSTSDTGKYATVSVQILDANGNKPSAEDTVGVVVLTGLKKGDVLEGTKSTEGEVQLTHISEGLFKATIVSEKSGDDVLSFKYGETLEAAAQSGNRAKVTYVAGAISLEESTIKIEPGSITADGQMSATVTVEAKDEFGNTILVESSEPLYLEGVETGILANEQLVYVGAGKYNAIITSTKTGIDKEIGFKVGSTGSKSAKTESLEYTPGDMNLGASTIEINKPSFVVGDAEGAIVTIQFNDANGNKIDGKVVGEIRLNGVVLGNAGDVTFVEKGRYTALITSEKTGMEKIGFSVDGANGANGDTVEVTYTAGDADIAFTEFTVSPVRIVANNETTAKFTVKLRDKFGNLVAASADNTIEIFTKNDPAIGQLSDVAIEKGVYIATVKSQKSGSEHFDFSLNGAKADRNDVSVDYLAGPAHVNTSEITADKQSITADGVASLTLTVSFKDEFGNTIEESRGNIVSIFSTLGSGKIGNLTPIKDNNDGTYSVSVTSTKIGEETFGFTIAGVKARSSVKVEYTPGKAAATTSVISITPDTIQADNVEEGIVSVKLHDIYGNPLNSNGDNAQIFLSGVSTGHYDGLALTHDDTRPGTFTGKITSETVGKDTVGFTLNGVLASGKKSTATIVYKAGGVSATNSIISSSNPKFVADGVESTVITVSLLDKDGHAIDDTTKLHNVILTGVKFGKYNNQVLESIGGGNIPLQLRLLRQVLIRLALQLIRPRHQRQFNKCIRRVKLVFLIQTLVLIKTRSRRTALIQQF